MVATETSWQGKAHRAYTQLRADIEHGILQPGRSLSEIELVEYTGASRTPVREALRRLAADGLVDLKPRRPPTVSRISLRGTRALFDFRRLVEPAAVRMVARAATESATVRDACLRVMDDLVALRGQPYSPAFAERFRQATHDFDMLLLDYTPNEYLVRAIGDLRPHLDRLRHIAHTDHARLQESVEEHLAMCSAILAGDADAAADALTQHLHHVDQAIFRKLLGGDADLVI